MAKEIVIDVKVDSREGVKGVDALESSMESLNETTEQTLETAEGLGQGLKKAGSTGKKGLETVSKGFRGVGLAIKAAGIGLVIGLFLALKEALGENQKALDFVKTATTAVGIVFNDMFNFVSKNFTPAIESISNAFSDIPATLIKVKDAIVNNIEVRFNALIDTFGLLGDAIKKLFSGDFAGALDDAGEAGKKYVDVLTGVENTVDRVVDGVTELVEATIDYTTSVIANSKAIVANTKALELLELQQTRIREQSDRDAERQRQIRDDFTKSFEERIAANEELGRILEEQEVREKKTVTDRIAGLQAQQAQLGATFERRKEIFALETELLAIEAQQEGFRSEQQVNKIALEKEQEDADQERRDEIAAKNKKRLEDEAKAEATVAKTKAAIRKAEISNVENGIKLLAGLDENSKGLQAASIIGANAVGIAKTVITTQAANAAAVAEGVALAIPSGGSSVAAAAALVSSNNISSGISIGASIAATAKGLAALKKSGGAGSKPSLVGGGGGGESASTGGLNPDTLFSTQEITGGEVDELGEGAGINQQPLRAIVLESDITNTQNQLQNFAEASQIG